MIATKDAARQVLRLSGLIGFAEMAPEGQDELSTTLANVSRNPMHAGRIVSGWLDDSRFVPTPRDIRDLAQRTDFENDPGTWKCAVCAGTGWEPVYEFHTWRDGNHKDTERVTKERYEYLQSLMRARYDNDYGVVGEQVVNKAVIRCTHCKTGRQRAEAEVAEKGGAQ